MGAASFWKEPMWMAGGEGRRPVMKANDKRYSGQPDPPEHREGGAPHNHLVVFFREQFHLGFDVLDLG